MAESLRILILEDNPADAELVQFELQEGGLAFTSKIVMTEEDFVREIWEFCPDLILSDYDLPKYNGALALAEARRRCPDTPFILVTGAVTEDRAIDILTQGAKDYVLKNRLQLRLVPAVRRALAEAEEHRARKQAEESLRESHRTLEERVKIRTEELEAEMTARKKTEDSLRDNEERQRLVLQASSIGTFEVDLLAGEGQWNATQFELLGLKPGDVNASPETFFRFVHPDDIERLRNKWEEATRSGKLDAEFRILRADGQECWLAGKGSFIFDGHPDGDGTGTKGKPRRFMGVNFDITGRKKAEEAVAAAQRQIQSIIDNTTAIIYAFDLEGRFVMANAAVAELLNSMPEQMIGRRRHEFMPKDDADWHEANDRKVIESGEALEFEEHSHLKDRSITWLTTKFPLHDAQDRIYAVAGISTDISGRKQAEEERQGLLDTVQRERDKLSALINSMTDEIWFADAEKRLTLVNPAVWKEFGSSIGDAKVVEEIAASFEVYRSDGTPRPADEAPPLRALRGEVVTKEEEIVLTPTKGEMRTREVSAAPVRDVSGAIIGSVSVVRDITERKHLEKVLEDSEKRYRRLFEASKDGVLILDAETGKIVDVNPYLLQLLGYSYDELSGKHLWEIGAFKDIAASKDAFKTLQENEFIRYEDLPLKTHAGKSIDVEFVSNVYLVDHSRVIQCNIRDITERKRVEEVLRASDEQFRVLIQNLQSAIALVDEHGMFRIVNNSFLRVFEIPLDATILNVNNRDWAQWQVFDEQGVLLEVDEHPVRKAALTRRAVKNQLVAVKSPSSPDLKWLLVSAEPILNNAGGTHRLICTYYDITQRKAAEEALKEQKAQLEDANRELESFSYSVSHDLKAPLRAIDGYSRMLLKKKEKAQLTEDTISKLVAIRSNAEKMNVLIDNLLSFSKVLKSSVAISEINVDKLVKEVWAEIQALNTERDLELRVTSLLPGKGDSTLIRQVIVNLLSNAAKYTRARKPGIIEVSCYSEDGNVVYCIKDNGVGFDMAYYNKLFGVFQRLHGDDEYEGTGVGLAIVQRIVQRHGGRIWAKGEVDKGATFYFTLPKNETKKI